MIDKIKLLIMNMPPEELWLVKECLCEREKNDKISWKVMKMVTVFEKCSPQEKMMFLEKIKWWWNHYEEPKEATNPIEGDGDLDLMEHFDGSK